MPLIEERKNFLLLPCPPAPKASKTLFLVQIFCVFRAVLFAGRTRNTLVVCALCAMLLERGILLFFFALRMVF